MRDAQWFSAAGLCMGVRPFGWLTNSMLREAGDGASFLTPSPKGQRSPSLCGSATLGLASEFSISATMFRIHASLFTHVLRAQRACDNIICAIRGLRCHAQRATQRWAMRGVALNMAQFAGNCVRLWLRHVPSPRMKGACQVAHDRRNSGVFIVRARPVARTSLVP